MKTEIHDVGQIERTLAWYGRQAWVAASKLGWRARGVRSWLIVLATAENESRLGTNRDALAQTFPARGSAMLDGGSAQGIALIDPRSKRREWLMRSHVDGRRAVAPYLDYRDFVRRGGG